MDMDHQQKSYKQKRGFMIENSSSNDLNNEEPFSQKINTIIDDILGEKAEIPEKEEFLKSIFLITRKHARELQDLIEPQSSLSPNTSAPNNSSNSNLPRINIYLLNAPTNTFYPQSPVYNQQQCYPIQNPSPQYPYPNGYQQPLAQQPIAQQPMIQQPGLPQVFQQPNPLFGPLQPLTEKKKHKSTSKKHKKDKHKSKDKGKDKDKKSSKDKKKEKGDSKSKIMTFEYSGGQQLSGIMRHLNDQTHGNIHNNGTIEITSSSNSFMGNGPSKLVNYNHEDCFRSDSSGSTTVCFDFKERSIKPTKYAIKSLNNGPSTNGPFLRNWVIEVSNDKSNWKQIDQHTDETRLRQSYAVGVFDITPPLKDFYRYIQLRQTGNSWDQNGSGTRIILRGMEFYGQIKFPATSSY